MTSNNKAYCLTATYSGAIPYNTINKKQRSMVAELADGYRPICVNSKIDGVQPSLASRIYSLNGKHTAVTTCHHPKIAKPAMFQSPRGYNKGGVKYGKAPTFTASKYQDNNFVIEGCSSCLRYERTETGKALRKQYESGEIEHGFNEHRNYAHARTVRLIHLRPSTRTI